MTNGELFKQLSERDKAKFRKLYSKHPLSEYIDWDAFYDSDNGNALDFVMCLEKTTNDEGNTILVLKEIQEDGEDYKLAFNCFTGELYKEPVYRETI